MHGAKLDHNKASEFIVAGKATFTVVNSKTSNRFTYFIKKKKTADVWFVSVLRGPDNMSDYSYFGCIVGGLFKFSTKKSVIAEDSQSVKVFAYLYSKLITNTLPEFIEIWHEGRCGKCGRKLTVPESIKSGMGPECGHRKAPGKNEARQKKLNLILDKI